MHKQGGTGRSARKASSVERAPECARRRARGYPWGARRVEERQATPAGVERRESTGRCSV
eukprot:392640-Pleurochrysis_carterae.AAC.1